MGPNFGCGYRKGKERGMKRLKIYRENNLCLQNENFNLLLGKVLMLINLPKRPKKYQNFAPKILPK